RCCSTGSSLRCIHDIARRGGMWKAREKARGCRRHTRRCGDAEGTREGGMRKAREKGRDAEGTREGAGCGRHAKRGGTRKAREKQWDAEGTREEAEGAEGRVMEIDTRWMSHLNNTNY